MNETDFIDQLHGYAVAFSENDLGHFWKADNLHPKAIEEGLNRGGPFKSFSEAYKDADSAMDDAFWVAHHANKS